MPPEIVVCATAQKDKQQQRLVRKNFMAYNLMEGNASVLCLIIFPVASIYIRKDATRKASSNSRSTWIPRITDVWIRLRRTDILFGAPRASDQRPEEW